MLYLDYSRKPGEWVPNKFGGRENLDAIAFIRDTNSLLAGEHTQATVIAEESTAWGGVSRPVSEGGLGFDYKWNMGWMHDTLQYMARDPVHRPHHHDELTFGPVYAFSENFVLPLSHDEVVHGKRSLLSKMPGDLWQRFANLRLLYAYMWAYPGKKLLFMGGEFGQWREWNHDQSLDWHLTQYPSHAGLSAWVRDLNRALARTPALHEQDFDAAGFAWIDCCDAANSVVAFVRRARDGGGTVLVVCNFTPVPRPAYRVGVPVSGRWRETLNSDAREYGGSGLGNLGGVQSDPVEAHGQPQSIALMLPPLGVLYLEPVA